MSDDPEQDVHYQISITRRQAASFFFGLLVALGLSFFFGMKTGQAARPGTDGMTRLAGSSDLVAGSSPSYSTSEEARRAESVVAEVGEKKLGFDDAAPKEAAKKIVEPEVKAPLESKSEGRPDPKADVSISSPPKPEPKAAPATPPAKPAPKKETKKETGPFYVQILATKDPEVADRLVQKLLKAGGFVKPDVSAMPGKAGTFRVRVGPYPDHAKVDKVTARLKDEKWNVEPSIVKGDKP